MPSTWLTAADLARRLGRRESVIRSWRDRHREFLPSRLDRQGRQTYQLARVLEIAALYGQRMRSAEVQAELARRHPDEDDGAVEPDRLGQILDEVRRIGEQVDWLVEREKERGS